RSCGSCHQDIYADAIDVPSYSGNVSQITGGAIMANPEHLEILKQGVETWNQWRNENSDVTPDLSRVTIIGVDLREANLGRTKLYKATLVGVDLREANLRRAELYRTTLIGTDLREANLRRANLIGANLAKANLGKTDLIDADLTGADLTGADLNNAIGITRQQIFKAKIDKKTKLPVRTENFVTLYFQKFRAISSNPYPSQMALSVNG